MKFKVKHAPASWLKSKLKYPVVAWTLSILWLVLICWLAFLGNLGNIGLVDETEPLFAEAARQMTVTGDWITPFFNGETRFDKPPLVYWLMAIAYQTIGANEWAVRLPSALSAIALTVFGFFTLRHFGYCHPNDKGLFTNNKIQLWLSAWIGSALISLNPETIAWGRTGVSDMLLSGCMGGALLAFFWGYASEGNSITTPRLETRVRFKRNLFSFLSHFDRLAPRFGEAELHPDLGRFLLFTSPWYISFYFLTALAVLTKGPVGVVLPVLIITAFLLYVGNGRKVLQEMRPLVGGSIVIAIALPWYVLCTLRNGEKYIDSFFGYHNLERFTEVVNGHSAPWYFYFLVVLIGFAPWSIYLPAAIAKLRFWQRDRWRQYPRSAHLGLFALFWFVGIFGFFTIAKTKLPSYVLPLMPASAILVSLLFGDRLCERVGSFTGWQVAPSNLQNFKSSNSNGLFWSGLFNAVFLLIVAGAIFYLPNLVGYDPAVPDLQQLLRQSGLPVIGGVIWAIAAAGVALAASKRQWGRLWSVNLVGFLAFLIFVLTPAYFLMDRTRQLPLRQLSAIAARVRQPGEELIMIGFKKPSVVFYSRLPVTYIDKTYTAIKYLEGSAVQNLKPPTTLILTQPQQLNKIGFQPERYEDLGTAGAYRLIRISKKVKVSS